MYNLVICFQLTEINAKFVVCDPETEEEVKQALHEMNSVGLLSIGRVDGCDDLVALAEEALEGIFDRSFPDITLIGFPYSSIYHFALA